MDIFKIHLIHCFFNISQLIIELISETDILFSIIEDLKKNNIAIAYISHRLEEIGKISDYVTVLKDGKHMATKEIQNINFPINIHYNSHFYFLNFMHVLC